MELLQRTISLESSTDRTRNSPTWGTVTASTFFLTITLFQSMDDMGLFTDMDYILDIGANNPLTQPYSTFDNYVLRNPLKTVSDYYMYQNAQISGYTDSKIEDVKSYAILDPYRVGFNTETETYINYENITVSGVNRIKTMGYPNVYVFNTPDDLNLGTNNQIYGTRYMDFSGKTRTVINEGVETTIGLTQFAFIGEGFNQSNITLSAITKFEYLFGIIYPPEVKSDVFIDRGITSVIDKHLRLAEINDLGHLTNYGNGYYQLNKQ